jgi:hypothetical protein
MLSRFEIGSREHILLWLSGRDENQSFDWNSHRNCPAGQYSREILGEDSAIWGANLNYLSSFAGAVTRRGFPTFGKLYEYAAEQWQP